LVGAVAGALPVLIGWTATGADFGTWAAVAFGVLFLWQIPHFLAIAWWGRSDYTRAGYHVLPFDDQRGYWTAGSALVYAAATVVVSFVPVWLHQVTGWYWPGALILGILFLAASIRFLTTRSETTARALFFVSLAYLPGLYLLMLRCRING
ncbi:MAG TPA: UbiA family prenyltransferase, partial [Candidatus Paceibacterota bacterium]|nr:UbiA family prenyltransferase [Candidatus Paceibacterota bacterium]